MTIVGLSHQKIPGWQCSTIAGSAEIRNNLRFPIKKEDRDAMAGGFPYYGPTGELARINEFRIEGRHMLIGEDGDHFLKFREKQMTLLVEGKFNVNNHAHLVRGTVGCKTEWLFYYLNHADLTPFLTRQGVGRFKLTKETLLKIPIQVPPVREQNTIVSILTTWDEALEKFDALIQAKEQRKKALMQQLLHQASGGDEVGHSRHRLGEVLQRVTRKNKGGNQNVLTISAQHGLVNQKDYFNRSVAAADLSGYYLLKKGEFAYNRSSAKGYPFGAIKQLESYEEGVMSTLYLCFGIKVKEAVSASYLCHYFESGLLNRGLQSIAKEGARAHGLLNVTAGEFFDLDIFLPRIEQQTKIAAVLDTCDKELRVLSKKRDAIDRQKRGLMQRLLTGKVRVKS